MNIYFKTLSTTQLFSVSDQITLAKEILKNNDCFFVIWTPLDIQKVGKRLGYFIEYDYARTLIDSICENHDSGLGISTDIIEDWINGQT